MSDRYPALGFDPAPGDVSAVDALCASVQSTLQTLARVRSALHSFGDPGAVWQGEAAEAFSSELTELTPFLERAEQSHREARAALASWADDLHGRQLAARSLEDRAEAARRTSLVAGQAAQDAASRARTALVVGAGAAGAAAAASAAAHRLDVAEQELADLRERARRLNEEHRSGAARVAGAVRAAADVAPVGPGVFERLGSALIATVAFPSGIDDWFVGWCRDNPHVLGELADVLADATVVAGVVAIAVPCPATALVAAGLALATLGTRAASDAAGLEVPTSTYLFDGLSLAAGASGAAAAVGVRNGKAMLAEGHALGWGGSVRNGQQSVEHFGRRGQRADKTGAAGSVTSTGLGLSQNDGDDRPFLHFVPDSKREAAAAVLLGPAGTAVVSAFELGRAKDRAAAAQAERDRWNR